MTQPGVGITGKTTTVEPDRSIFQRSRGQAPGETAAFASEFNSSLTQESRSIRSRSGANPASDPAAGEIPLAFRSPRVRGENDGVPGEMGPREAAYAEPSGFVRSQSPDAPHLPRFENVPETAKFPSGPYHQAPAEFGGEWWLVNPFTGPQPWLRTSLSPNSGTPAETLPEGFAEIFGPRPSRQTHPDYFELRVAKLQWEQDLKSFKRTGMPEGLDEAQLAASEQAFEEWGLGKPAFYEGAHGWRIVFPDGAVPGFEMSPQTALQAPHIVIAKYQIRLLQQGTVPESVHPWVPPHLLTPSESV